jgi:diguanylate cyclase (GGDEF)-like protein
LGFVISSLKSNVVFLGLLILTFFLGAVNHWLGFEISFSIFYWIPILLAVWFLGPKRAAVIAVMSALFWFHADTSAGHVYSNGLIPIWNAAMRFAMFVTIIFFSYQLKRELHNEREMGRRDSLTGLFNFRYLSETMDAEIRRSLRFKKPFSVMYIDLDNFKRVNDEFGHDQGDILIAAVANVFRCNLRGYDVAARVGGDEFVVLLPETDAVQVRETIMKLMGKLREEIGKRAPFVTFSIGAFVCTKALFATREIISQADKLMYQVKIGGKNNFLIKVDAEL